MRRPAGTIVRVTCLAGQVQEPASRSIRKSSLGKWVRLGRPGTLAIRVRARVGEGLTGTAVAVSGVAHGLLHRHTGVGLTLFHQFQRPQVVGSVCRAIPPPR